MVENIIELIINHSDFVSRPPWGTIDEKCMECNNLAIGNIFPQVGYPHQDDPGYYLCKTCLVIAFAHLFVEVPSLVMVNSRYGKDLHSKCITYNQRQRERRWIPTNSP